MSELDSGDSVSAAAALSESEEVWEPVPGVTLRGHETIALVQNVLAQLSCGCVDTCVADSKGADVKSGSDSA